MHFVHPSMQMVGAGTVLSIDPTSTILKADALRFLQFCFLTNQPVGLANARIILDFSEVDKAEAAYVIAGRLVNWAEKYEVVRWSKGFAKPFAIPKGLFEEVNL